MLWKSGIAAVLFTLASAIWPQPGSAKESWSGEEIGVLLQYPASDWDELDPGASQAQFAIGSFVTPGTAEGEIWRSCMVVGKAYAKGEQKPLTRGDVQRTMTEEGGKALAQARNKFLTQNGYVIKSLKTTPINTPYPAWEFRIQGHISGPAAPILVERVARLLYMKDTAAFAICEIYPDRLPARADIAMARAEVDRILASFAPLAAAALPAGGSTASTEESLIIFGQVIGFLIVAFLLYRLVRRLIRRRS